MTDLRAMLAPFDALQAFSLDAEALRVEEDESRLPVRWLAAAQLALRFSNARPAEVRAIVKSWVDLYDNAEKDSGGVMMALSMPGIAIRDLGSSAMTLAALAREAREGGALHLAYCISMNARVTLLERGPVAPRVHAWSEFARSGARQAASQPVTRIAFATTSGFS